MTFAQYWDAQYTFSAWAYLQVVDQKLVEGRVSIQVDQEAFVLSYFDARWLQRDAQTL